tara:strand:+ start:1842 stop:2063 length:222 start_codon:yes stop_codon:yes gene_type:complete
MATASDPMDVVLWVLLFSSPCYPPVMNTKDKYSDEEAAERFEKTLRGALSTPPQPLKNKPSARPESKAKKEAR